MSADHPLFTRREMLRRTSLGFGSLAFAGLFANRASGAAVGEAGSFPYSAPAGGSRSAVAPHFKPRVKHVILCYMSGGVSHVDSFDPKPELKRRHGQPMPVPVRPTVFNENGNIMASPWEARSKSTRLNSSHG